MKSLSGDVLVAESGLGWVALRAVGDYGRV